jgi:hypothetical protein
MGNTEFTPSLEETASDKFRDSRWKEMGVEIGPPMQETPSVSRVKFPNGWKVVVKESEGIAIYYCPKNNPRVKVTFRQLLHETEALTQFLSHLKRE